MIGAEFAGELRLVRADDHANYFQLRGFGKIDQRVAHAAGRRVDQYRLAFSERKRIIEDVIGDLIIGERAAASKLTVAGKMNVASAGVAMNSA